MPVRLVGPSMCEIEVQLAPALSHEWTGWLVQKRAAGSAQGQYRLAGGQLCVILPVHGH